VFLLTGCVGLQLGGGSKNTTIQPSVGQQLVDLKKARDAGAITEDEYRCQRAKLLGK
jgi:hypothetical protein